MRALVMTEPFPGPDRTQVQSICEPVPSATQVSIDVVSAGINFIDVMARRGDPGYVPHWPYVPGLEVAGTVRALGSQVSGLAVGQRVAAFTRGGGLAEVAVAEAALVVPLPDSVPFSIAAAAPLMLSTALLLLTDVAQLRAGDTVLMHSASGGIGSAVAQLVPILGGGQRIGTVGRADKVSNAQRSGWETAVVRDNHVTETVRAAAGGGVDVILDPCGTSLVDLDLDLAAPGARIALFGNPSGSQPAPLPPLAALIGGNVALAGFSMSRLTANAPQRAAGALRRVVDLLAAGQLDIPITQVTALTDVPAVHQLLAHGRGNGKYVATLTR
jgi:NADPH2:quinone reductase